MGFDVNKATVGEFLKRGSYVIPQIQRRYSWNAEQQERLWKDLETFHKDEHQEFYLLHTVITVQESMNERIEILDGQQRTTTMLAMISAALDVVEENGKSEDFRFYVSDLRDTLRNRQGEPRLITSYEKDAPMLEWVQTVPVTRGAPSRISRVWKAYNFYLTRCFQPIIEEEGADVGCERILKTLSEGLLKECYVTMAKFNSMPEAVTAFDTTNNRGKDLTLADLLRYWMLKNAQRHGSNVQTSIEEGWKRINDDLDDKEKDIKDFVVRYWCAWIGERYQQSKLLKYLDEEMRTTYTAEAPLLREMANMTEAATKYHALVNPSTSNSNRRALRLMRKAGASQHLTTLLAGAMKGYSDSEMGQLINLTERVFFWYQIIAERGGSALYQRYCEWAGIILGAKTSEEGLASLTTEVSEFIVEQGLDHEILSQAFLNFNTEQTSKVMFILAHLETHVNPEADFSDEDDLLVHLIAPAVGESGGWSGWDEESRDQRANNIGNWMLLPADSEALPEGYGIGDVAARADASAIATTSSLAYAQAWTPDDVTSRQAEMFELCLEIWPL